MDALGQVLAQRQTLWCEELEGFGYEIVVPGRPPSLPSQFTIRAQRQPSVGPPGVMITIKEQWAVAVDIPSGLPVRGGFYPVTLGWHAQFEGQEVNGELAERLDVDPKKDKDLMIHRHPIDCPNEVRKAEHALLEPAEWIERVELIVFDRSPDLVVGADTGQMAT